jgi:LacI family transcriptional regulator
MSTIYDVARAAGVSPKTVSRVLNGDAPVGPATREAVDKAIRDLGYVPSSAARTMRSNRSGLIGLITGAITLSQQGPEVSGLPEIFIVQGIQKALESSGMTLMISDTGGRAERVADLMRTFTEHRVEGLIHVADYHKKVELPAVASDAKLVLANCYDDAGTPSVLPNDYQGQKALVRELVAHGHRRIAYISLSRSLDATRLRTQGYVDALHEAGIVPDETLVIPADLASADPDAEVQLLWDALDRVLTLPAPPTVICCGNDRMAMRAYGMLRSRGLSIPDDISIAGYDNYRLVAETLFPRLTTVELPYAAMGIHAAEMLLSLIRDDEPPPADPRLVSGPVCWRDSVASLNKPITQTSLKGRTTS